MHYLFNRKILNRQLASYSFPRGKELGRIEELIAGWQKALCDGDLSKTKEKSVQGKFLNVFFEQILGYKDKTRGDKEWSLVVEPTTEVDSSEADGSIGFFTKEDKQTLGVIELKDAKTSLDKKQTGRDKGYTPVEQGHLYSNKFDGCKWVIVSNFREIRLYKKSRTSNFCEKFDILDLLKEYEFKRFYFLFNKDNLIAKGGESLIDDLANRSIDQEEDISKKFYGDYKTARGELYEHLGEQNKGMNRGVLFEKTQKILDRLVFILFCEDTANLLPPNILKNVYENASKSRQRSDERVWIEIKNLFIDIDRGRDDISPRINAYNGGLFEVDDTIDMLHIKDSAWEKIIALSDYDFGTDLNVNILGHIFEQSISDIEDIKAEIDGEEVAKNKQRRKKSGIFYTPENITKYIVENSLGRYLEEHPDKLDSVRILDPACGSGAFLNQAHSFLLNAHRLKHEQKMAEQPLKKQLDWGDVNLVEQNRSILLNNLYGVDLSAESAEITKLSLWLKTARSTEPLQNLDDNIRVGNSLIDDPEVAGDRAFNWEAEFRKIMADGGFDVIVGNPPYVKLQNFRGSGDAELQYILQNYETTRTGSFDLYVPFIERAYKLLRPGGYLAFIAPNVWIFNDYGESLRKFVAKHKSLVEFLDFKSFQVFEDATTYTAIQIFKKGNEDSLMYYPSPKGEIIGVRGHQIDYDDLGGKSWSLTTKQDSLIMEKMDGNSKKLGDIARIAVGVQTSADAIYHLRRDQNGLRSKSLDEYVEIEAEILKPLVSGEDVKRYQTPKTDKVIIFPYKTDKRPPRLIEEQELQGCLPKAYDYLKRNETMLRARERGKMNIDGKWWGYNYPKNISIQHIPKLMVARLVSSLQVAIDDKGEFTLDNVDVNGVFPAKDVDPHYLLGILNSRACNFYFTKVSKPFRGETLSANKQFIAPLPVPVAAKKDQDTIAILTKEIIEINTRKWDVSSMARDLLISEYDIKMTSRFKNLDQLGWNVFMEEFEKQKIKLSLDQKEDLQKWFRKKQSELVGLCQKIDSIDMEIDRLVYELYGLARADIETIEES